jgi:hypothetical protein
MVALQANSRGQSCGGISSESPPVGVVNGDDAAFEQLIVIDAAGCRSEHIAGRPSTLWSATAGEEQDENETCEADAHEVAATFIWGLIALLAHLNLVKRWKIIDARLITFCI